LKIAPCICIRQNVRALPFEVSFVFAQLVIRDGADILLLQPTLERREKIAGAEYLGAQTVPFEVQISITTFTVSQENAWRSFGTLNSAKRIRFKTIVLLVNNDLNTFNINTVPNMFNTKKMDDAVEFPSGKINFE
jgi:hypothetical protein